MATDPAHDLALRICVERGYSLIRECGAGTFKRTFQVQQGAEDFALKLIVNASDAERVRREVDALTSCDHPSISRLIDVGIYVNGATQVVYIVEGYLSGGTLTEKIDGWKTLARDEVVVLGGQLIGAISHLQARNLVHRDVKPDNIMFDSGGVGVLLDLGIARHLDASSLTATWLAMGPGTPAFAPPEQLLNEKHLIDWRCDQFSLGITLGLAALGIHAYTGQSDFAGVTDLVGRRSNLHPNFVRAAQNSNLFPLVTMVDPWPIRRFSRPDVLARAWNSI